MAQAFELNTTISNLRDLTESDLSPYDALYLGNITCRLYEANLLERLDDLREAIALVKGRGQKAYVSTYAAPRNDHLPQLRKVVAVAVKTGADAVEVHNLGVLKIIHEAHPDLAVHIGGFANVYTDVGAAVLKRYGAVRITPNYELSLEEIGQIQRQVGMPMELLVHGKMPLGVSDDCFLLEYEQAWGVTCPALCQQELFLKQGDWAMQSIGKGVMSGKDICLLEHLTRLMTEGHSCFRVEAASESPAYRLEIGRVYREALEAALCEVRSAKSPHPPFTKGGHGGICGVQGAEREAQGEGKKGLEGQWWDTIRRHARIGLCNGFYFGTSGMAYHGVRHSGADTAEDQRCGVGQ